MASNSIVSKNLVPSDPSLIDLLKLHKEGIFLDLNCHAVGTIQSFDGPTQTASVSINYKKTFFNFDKTNFTFTSNLQNYPLIAECPVIFLGGGTTAFTSPVTQGDECLVVFNDRDLDNWFTGGTGAPNATARLHSYADAIALVGLRSMANVISNFDTTRAMMRAGTTANSIAAVGVNPTNSKVLITNSYPANTTTLNTLIQNLITQVGNLVTAIGTTPLIAVTGSPGGPSPINPAITTLLTTVSTSLMTLSTEVSGVLE